MFKIFFILWVGEPPSQVESSEKSVLLIDSTAFRWYCRRCVGLLPITEWLVQAGLGFSLCEKCIKAGQDQQSILICSKLTTSGYNFCLHVSFSN